MINPFFAPTPVDVDATLCAHCYGLLADSGEVAGVSYSADGVAYVDETGRDPIEPHVDLCGCDRCGIARGRYCELYDVVGTVEPMRRRMVTRDLVVVDVDAYPRAEWMECEACYDETTCSQGPLADVDHNAAWCCDECWIAFDADAWVADQR
jgi:hypothetical protein